MLPNRNRVILALALITLALLTVACTRAATTPQATPTVVAPSNPFPSPLTPAGNPMSVVEGIVTQTAMARLTQTPGTPAVGGGNGTPITPAVTVTTPTVTSGTPATPTFDILNPVVITGTPATPTSTLPVLPSTSSTPLTRPASYTLQQGEFPYCIARRFDVDPDSLLALNGLTDAGLYYPGLVLKIPQSGHFPGTRAWHAHPANHTVGVTSQDTTLYGVACYYGDIEPSAIAQANTLTAPYTLRAGQVLRIP